jgi:hypothetical protein
MVRHRTSHRNGLPLGGRAALFRFQSNGRGLRPGVRGWGNALQAKGESFFLRA